MYLHIFDRSDTGSIEHAAQHPNMCLRTDVVLMNNTNSGLEHSLHVTRRGFTGDLWLLDVLSKEQYLEVVNIANRIRGNPDAAAYIVEV